MNQYSDITFFAVLVLFDVPKAYERIKYNFRQEDFNLEKVRYMISDAAAAVDVETHVLRYWEDELGLDVPRNDLVTDTIREII